MESLLISRPDCSREEDVTMIEEEMEDAAVTEEKELSIVGAT